jgi:ParB-like chromosome segregation protein Spo0J
LSQLDGRWPPILVTRDHAVVDGAHRFHAAKRSGLTDIACEYFDGSPEDAALEFVLRNVRQGLPLSLSEREEGASKLLDLHEDWSDRRIATSCGLSPRTIAAIRRSQGADSRSRPDAQSAHVDKRLGTDNKMWPIDRSAIRQRVKEAIQKNPGMSLRRIADEAQVSPETVRRAKARFQTPLAEEAVIKGKERPDPVTPLRASMPEVGKEEPWRADRALCSLPGTDFVDWFQRTVVGDEWQRYVSLVPLSRVYEIADEARRRARLWVEFAGALEGRTSEQTRRAQSASGG